jgi:hydroxyacylglutathione hydrolase
MLQIWPVRVYSDNYVWVLETEGSRQVAVVDPGEAAPVLEALQERDLDIGTVLVTHHHGDHVGGLREIVHACHPAVYGSANESIAKVDHPVHDRDRIHLPEIDLHLGVIDLCGHTSGHVGYLGDGFAFVGDTLFGGGCGRVFEGTFEQMYRSLTRLAALPAATEIYCAHEYTLTNLRFAREVEPENLALADRIAEAEVKRSKKQPTVPSTIALELATNPFLRCFEPTVVTAAENHADRALESDIEVFGVLRRWKDEWTG